MSGRFEWDDYEPVEYNNGAELYEARAIQTLYGKKGRKALAEVREALMALPKRELIEGAVCRRKPVDLGDDPVVVPEGQLGAFGMPIQLDADGVAVDVEGVCVIGAYLWLKEVKAGKSAQEAFAALPALDSEDGDGDEMWETAWQGSRAGLMFTLAWELESANDETFAGLAPAERWQRMVDAIDGILASPPLKRGDKLAGRKKLGQSWTA